MKNTKKRFKIGIIGHGTVGRAIAAGFSFIADIKIYDKYYPVDPWEEVAKSWFIFVCVPTPSKKNGEIDLSIMDEVMEKLSKDAGGIVIIKSTVVPGTTRSYLDKYPEMKIINNPEFLTDRTAMLDFVNPSRILLGGNIRWTNLVEKLYQARIPSAPIYKGTSVETELVKYICNSFFAVKISFFNEFYRLGEMTPHSYNRIKEMVLADGRIGNSHMDIPGHDGKHGWGGSCFPKDTKAICKVAERAGTSLKVIEAAIKSNEEIRELTKRERIGIKDVEALTKKKGKAP